MLQECTDVNRKLVGDAGFGLAPYGPVQSNPVFYGHFDSGYANIRQPHIFKRLIQGKNLVLHSSNYSMMQIHSLNKLGKSVVQKSSLEPHIYFLLSKVCSLAILLQYTCGMGKIVTEILYKIVV